MLRYTEFDRQKVRALLDEQAVEVEREVRLTGYPDAAIERNKGEIERLRQIMTESERENFDKLIDAELAEDQRKAREELIITRYESREAQVDCEARRAQEAREEENGKKITAYLVCSVIGLLIVLFLFR